MLHYEMLFAAMSLEQFHLMGASMGGHFAARYAGEHREEIDRLVLISPAGMYSPDAAMPDFSKISAAELPSWFVADRSWIEPYWPSTPSAEWLAIRAREGAAAAVTREDPKITDKLLRDCLAGFDRPALLLWGENDRIVPLAYAKEWQAALPHAELAVIEGGGHLLLDEFPAACLAAKDFLLG